MDAGLGEGSHKTRGDEGGTKDRARNGTVELNTPVADNGVIGSIIKYLAVDHGLCLRKIANVIDSDPQSKLGLDVA